MPRTSAGEIELQDFDQVAARETELGDLTVSFLTFKQDTDMAPMLAGLPTRSCQCPHWGVLTAGRATVRYDDGRSEEKFKEADLPTGVTIDVSGSVRHPPPTRHGAAASPRKMARIDP